METQSGSPKSDEAFAVNVQTQASYRSGEELWKLLDYSTGKRIKGHWRNVPKMVELFTRANERHSFNMSPDEVQRLAQYLHDVNRPAPGTIDEYLSLWPIPIDFSAATPSDRQIAALLDLDRVIRGTDLLAGPVHWGTTSSVMSGGVPVQTKAVRLIEYFDGRKQSIIPLYQRPYSWKEKEWEILWDDIRGCHRSDGKLDPHFMGAIVSLAVTTTPIGVNKHLIIDGQQRLTTVSILLCAIRRFLDEKTKDRIPDFLINRHDEGIDMYKVAPTQVDRATYECIVSDKEGADKNSQIYKADLYFKKKFKALESDEDGITPLRVLEIVESALRVVMIDLDPDQEDPYEIFESLNFKGTDLTPADLVRNFVLMKYKHSLGDYGDQKRIYDDYWRPIEIDCGEDLPQFLLHYCRLNGNEVRKKNIYPAFKKMVETHSAEELEVELAKMKRLSAIYPRFVNPEEESEERIKRPLMVLKMLGVTVFYPLLMRLFGAEANGTIPSAELYEALDVLDAYLIRRSVCNVKNNALDSLTTQLLNDWDEAKPAKYLREVLSKQTGNLSWPRDQEFLESFVKDRQYGRKSANWVLWRLEDSHGHKEELSAKNIQIEHILPQTPSESWLKALSADEKQNIDRWIDTYGNLTLTGYNGELGNKGFAEKREIYAKSHFEINRTIANEKSWGIESIMRRGQALAEMAVGVWSGPLPAAE